MQKKTNKQSYRMATTKEIIHINKRLEEFIKKNEDGTCYYIDNWSDQRILDELDGSLNIGAVQRVRKEIFGGLFAKGVRTGGHPIIRTRVTVLENQLRRLMDLLAVNANERAIILGNADNNAESIDD